MSSRILQQPDIKLYPEVILLKNEGSPWVRPISFIKSCYGHYHILYSDYSASLADNHSIHPYDFQISEDQ